ncbi:MAG: cytochrome c4 [Nitrosomonadales bacterium]|nr:cytochrome c4 [Nitrosomonadales bacterium]
MICSRINVSAVLVIMLLTATAVFAADSASDIKLRMGKGDPVNGKIKVAMCRSCHGEDGNGTSADFPKLSGQYAEYIQKQLYDFRSGARKNPIMAAMAASIATEQDIVDLSAYFASLNKMSGDKPVANKAGEARFLSLANGCVSCHGDNGKGLAPDISHAPVIGGQYKEYLVRQMKSFRKGTRKNDPGGIMGTLTSEMTDEEIENVASYVSGL